MKILFFTTIFMFFYAVPSLATSLEEELKDRPKLLSLAKQLITKEAIYSENVTIWNNFNAKDKNDLDDSYRLTNALRNYFTPIIKNIFDKKRAFTNKEIEWQILQDEYLTLVNYKELLEDKRAEYFFALECGSPEFD